MLFYPKNFPVQLEQILIRLLKLIEKDFNDKIPQNSKQFNQLLNKHLSDRNLQYELKGKKPSSWWLNFVLIRHFKVFNRKFIDDIKSFLIKTKTRSLSGVVTLTLFTKNVGCPFHCVYCPNEPNMPKSYLSDEPAVMRAIRHNFDPFKQTQSRLIMLYLSNHPIDKVEVIIKGGTFSFYEEKYRKKFVKKIFDACNSDVEFLLRTGKQKLNKSKTLIQTQKKNETAKSRIIGINIETRPDYVNKKEIVFLRQLGVTHVESGVQILNNTIYKLIKRSHTVATVKQATLLLKDAGFKVGYHLMLNLPGSTPKIDMQSLRKVYNDNAFKPDHLKLYPTTITLFTELSQWYKNGKYKPYSLKEMVRCIIDFKIKIVPPWTRIGRLTRDITTTMMENKQFPPNLREIIQAEIHKKNFACYCIRCREIRDNMVSSKIKLRTIQYSASLSKEFFVEYIDEKEHSMGFLRLRKRQNSTIVRELHVYGQSLAIGEKKYQSVQHQSIGKQLLKKAELLTKQLGFQKIYVIAGIGVREYYRKLGYKLQDTYMIKTV